MTQDYLHTCIGILNSLLCQMQEGNKKYLFVVDSTDLFIEIMKEGYNSIVINSMEDVAAIADTLSRANMAANNIITIGCCKSSVNETIKKAIDDTRYIDGYKIFEGKKAVRVGRN